MGGGEEGPGDVDIGAHVFGFVVGLAAGVTAGAVRAPERLGARGQVAAAIGTLGLLVTAWSAALLRG